MVQNINPAEVNIQFFKNRTVKINDIVTRSYTEKKSEKFWSLIWNNLPDSYAGMSEKYSESRDLSFECNSHQFSSDSDIKIVKIFPQRKITIYHKPVFN